MPEIPSAQLFVAVKAFIVREGKLLLLRESSRYEDGTNVAKYDLPGGRIEPGEALDAALAREVQEETGCRVASAQAFSAGEWWPQKNGAQGVQQWHIVGVYFAVKLVDDTQITLSRDHDDFIWADIAALPDSVIDTWKPVVAQHKDFLVGF